MNDFECNSMKPSCLCLHVHTQGLLQNNASYFILMVCNVRGSGIAAEVEPSHEDSVKFCCPVRDGVKRQSDKMVSGIEKCV